MSLDNFFVSTKVTNRANAKMILLGKSKKLYPRQYIILEQNGKCNITI